ncbi:MAG: DegQ family serine endoprotease [Candidatus Binatia bacterium]
MSKGCLRVFVLALLVFLLPLPAVGEFPVGVGSESQTVPTLAPILKKITPAVVNIAVLGHVAVEENPLLSDPFFKRFFNVPEQPAQRQFQAAGSGVIVDAAEGYILTNNHVVENADEVTVTLSDGRHLKAKLVGTDPEADVAVIQVPAEKLTALPLGDSDKLEVGDFVVAVGNPFGLGQTVTSGIVSALGRRGLGIEGYEDFIQTDASINPGNSGGALVNLRGELIGINTAIVGPSGGNVGIGFAIPVNMARAIMTQLIKHGVVLRGQLGVQIQDLTPQLADALGTGGGHGAVVAQVLSGSPAAKAGVKPGDVIVSVNGVPVQDSADLRNKIGLIGVGESVALGIVRNGKTSTISAVLVPPRQAKVRAGSIDPRLGGALFGAIEEGSPLFGHVEGVEVLNVQRGSPAWSGGLRKGDVIIAINQQRVRTPAELREAAKTKKQALLLNVQRGESALFIVIQ